MTNWTPCLQDDWLRPTGRPFTQRVMQRISRRRTPRHVAATSGHKQHPMRLAPFCAGWLAHGAGRRRLLGLSQLASFLFWIVVGNRSRLIDRAVEIKGVKMHRNALFRRLLRNPIADPRYGTAKSLVARWPHWYARLWSALQRDLNRAIWLFF